MRKAVVILPTYNEAGTIETVITQIFQSTQELKNWVVEVLVVDSASTDKTDDIVKKLQKQYKKLHLLPAKKEGLGKAYIQGFQYAIDRLEPTVLFEMDSDLSHDPKKIPEFLKAIEKGADFVIGSRYMKGGSIPSNWGLHRKLFSILGNLIIRFGFLKLRVTDWTDGYRAIKAWVVKDALPHLNNYSGYVFQIALLDNAIKSHAHITEIPVHFIDRTYGSSKINAGQYIRQILWYVFTHSSFIKFGIVGGIGFVLDYGISYLLIEHLNKPIWFATLLSTETAIISNFILNNYWSFAHKRIHHAGFGFIWNFLKFNFISSGSILIQTLSIHFLSDMLGEQYWYIYKFFIIVCVIIPYSYILYNRVVWKNKT